MCLSRFHSSLCWSKVRSVGNSVPARASLIVPFIGYLLLFNEHARGILKLSYPFLENRGQTNIDLAIHEVSSLYWTYFGLLSFGIASILYQIFCAAEVKDYANQNQYIDAKSKSIIDEEVLIICKLLVDRRGKITDISRIEAIRDVVESSGSRSEKSTKYVLYSHYKELDFSYRIAIFFCFYLYNIGLVFLAIPTVFLTYKIVKAII